MVNILRRIKYPKFLLLFITFLAAYLLFYGESYPSLRNYVSSSGYIGTFIAGVLYAYGFTAGFAVSIFLILAKHQNIYLAGVIGGLGSLFTDLVLFELVRHSFKDEIRKLAKEKLILYFRSRMPNELKKYIVPVMACVIIASPLPDEIGVTLLASIREFSAKVFSIISFALNTGGIISILYVGNLI